METLPDAQHRVSANERELGERIERALSAVVALDLEALVRDLPALPRAAPAEAARAPWWRRRREGRVAQSSDRSKDDVYKSTVRKAGAWTVPALFQSRVYKGMLILDLRQAVLSASATVFELNAYKSRVVVISPLSTTSSSKAEPSREAWRISRPEGSPARRGW